MPKRISVLSLLALLAACGSGASDTQKPNGATAPAAPSPELTKLVLASQPAGAVSVLEAKKLATADACAVSGRIANIVPGFAVLKLMDSSLPYCGEKNKEGNCKTPWDYCCESKDTQTSHSLLVEVRDANGKPIAGNVGDLRLLDAITVAGRLTKDEHGNHVLLATGWHRDTRPELPDHVKWPQ
ncbi:MAG: hypothetical protein WBO45_21200 [Planctomycetota bacterium]